MSGNIPKVKIYDLPLRHDVGKAIGSGKDNIVFPLVEKADAPHLRLPVGWVAKVNHEPIGADKHTFPSTENLEAARAGIEYKKNKYDILKHFLGDYIPKSGFVLTAGRKGPRPRYVELTLQEQIPQTRLDQLSEEQKQDPRLKQNLLGLLERMQYMYAVLGEANARSEQSSHLDAKLDLGGVSDAVRAERLDHAFNDGEIDAILQTNKSPNILVDPEKMQIFCIDFDQGKWTRGMDDTKALAFEIDALNKERSTARRIGYRGMVQSADNQN